MAGWFCYTLCKKNTANLSWERKNRRERLPQDDPINGIDPSGNFLAVTIGLLGGFGHGMYMNSRKATKDLSTGAYIMRRITSLSSGIGLYFATYLLYESIGLFYDYEPIWASGKHPSASNNLSINVWETNVSNVLKNHIDKRSNLTKKEKDKAKSEADVIAKNYVSRTKARASMLNILEDSDPDMYGIADRNTFSSWRGNWGNSSAFCAEWATEANCCIPDDAEFWKSTARYDYSPMGDPSIGFLFRHSFVSLEFQGESVFVLDPWNSGYPEIYSANSYFNYYGAWGLGYESK